MFAYVHKKKIRYGNLLKTNKQTNKGRKAEKKQFKGKITFFIRELQFHPNIWINPFREHELKSIVLEKWHVIDNNWCCRTYLQNVQEVSKKKQKQSHTNKHSTGID